MASCYSATNLRHATPEELAEILEAIAQKIGATYYCLSRPHLRETQFQPFLASNFPEDWQRSYLDKKYFRVDPVFADAMRSNLPVFRDESDDPPDAGGGEVVAERRLLGCRSGIVIPVRGRNGRFSVLSFWSTDLLADFAGRCDAHHDWLMARVLYLHDIADRKIASAWDGLLNEIELECLKWTSLGKTAWEISVLLGIPERTVHYHLAEASKRLGAPNKTGAVGVALRTGLLET